MEVHGQVAEIGHDVRGIHQFGFAFAGFAGLDTQAVAPG
jgi:hypothetical protein